MSTDLRRWFKSDSTASSSHERALEAAKMSVEKLEMEEIALQRTGRKRKSVERHYFDQEKKTAIGKHAITYGNKSAVCKYSFLKPLLGILSVILKDN